METTISTEIQADPTLAPVVRAADDVLVKAIGNAPEPPRAVWRISPNGAQRRQVELELLYHDESVTRQFVPDELRDTSELRYRTGRLWEDLLVKANQRTTDRLLNLLREWREEVELQET